MQARCHRPGLPPGEIISTSDGTTRFVRRVEGTGTPIVLLHGWSANADLNFASVFDHLAGHTIIAPDLRGHSDGPRGQFTLAAAANDVAVLLDELGTGPVVVVGYSMGGAITQALIDQRPDLIEGAVFAATAARFGTRRTWPLFRAAAAAGWLSAHLPAANLADVLSRVLGPTRPIPQDWSWASSDVTRHDWQAILDAALELERHDGRLMVRHRNITAASIITTQDAIVPPFRQYELARHAAAPVFTIDAGHTAPLTHPHLLGPGLLEALHHVALVTGFTKAA